MPSTLPSNEFGEEQVLNSIKSKLTKKGFEILEFKGVDIVATNRSKGGSDVLLIEVKAPRAGFVTVDNVAQVNSAAQAYLSAFREITIKTILIGNYAEKGRTLEIAGDNSIQPIQINSNDALGVVTDKLDKEFDKIITHVS